MFDEDNGSIRAAGGVVWRRSDDHVEILTVHRRRYDDWSLPKGKVDPGEGDVRCALREVEEETGLCCQLGPELASTEYVDRKGRHKLVRYWAMLPLGGRFTPGDEVDDIRWVRIADAVHHLTYERDLTVLMALLDRLALSEKDR